MAAASSRALPADLRVVIDSVDEGVCAVDRNGVVILYNRAAAALDGLDEQGVAGRHLLEAFPSQPRRTEALLRVLATGQAIHNRQRTFTARNGEAVTIVSSALPVTVDGRLVGAVEVSRDITLVRDLARRTIGLQMKLLAREQGVAGIEREGARFTFADIVGESRAMLELKRAAEEAATGLCPVLVHGETGTGKELLVQAIHNASPRALGPFVSEGCAALPENLLEEILLGTAEEGSSRGREMPGLFELAHGGSIYLDGIDSMPLSSQARLLRVLSEGRVRRVGDTMAREIDVRVMASMSAPPHEVIAAGRLREDLYHRLNGVRLAVPPLRERREDIPLLVAHLLARLEFKLTKSVKGVSDAALDVLQRYDWPGNVRELENALESALHTLCMQGGDIIVVDHIPEEIRERSKALPPRGGGFRDAVAGLETALVRKALAEAAGNISRTARLLGIPRQTLQYRLRKLGIR